MSQDVQEASVYRRQDVHEAVCTGGRMYMRQDVQEAAGCTGGRM